MKRLDADAALSAYKRWLSPLFSFGGASCRFTPTCSEYAAEAVARRGLMVGGALAVWRVLRCHPLSRGGFDPVSDSAGREARPRVHIHTVR